MPQYRRNSFTNLAYAVRLVKCLYFSYGCENISVHGTGMPSRSPRLTDFPSMVTLYELRVPVAKCKRLGKKVKRRQQVNKGILPWSDCAQVHRCFGQGKVGAEFRHFRCHGMHTGAWDRVTRETVRNCFKKAGIGSEVKANAVHGTNDPFKFLAEKLVFLRESCPECVKPDDVIETDQGLLTPTSLI